MASTAGSDVTAAIGIEELEAAVRRLLASHAELRSRAEEAEARSRALQDALRASSGEPDAVAITDRLATLENENTVLRNRLTEARAITDRIAARIQFAGDER
jgi:hypothetical protein